MTRYDADGNRDTVLNRARRFFTDNPDEMLTRDDLQVKFGCGPEMAKLVARSLIQEGAVTRDQLPRPPRAPRAAEGKVTASFPGNLTPGERAAIEAYAQHGSVIAAARATGRNYHTLTDQLQAARTKAGVHTTAELAIRWMREATAPAACRQLESSEAP